MRSLLGGVVVMVLGLTLGCGKTETEWSQLALGGEANGGGAPGPGGGGGQGGQSTGNETGGQSAGNETGGSAVATGGQGESGGNPAGGAALGGAAGHAAIGGFAPLVDCDPRKISCKRIAPPCPMGEVPSVKGICYGDCVKIEQCACNAAEQCPEPNQYTCWAGQHCGPFVR